MQYQPKNVLVIAGNDPSGGAGIAADITACSLAGCHAAPVITSLTVQDTQNVYAAQPVDVTLLRQQIEVVLADLPIHAVKLGVLANAEQIACVAQLLTPLDVPIVIDPVLVATGGGALTDNTAAALLQLLPQASIITPNHRELVALAAAAHVGDEHTDTEKGSAEQAIAKLKQLDISKILLTGGDENSDDVINYWYPRDAKSQHYTWSRLHGQFHGSGCTLASTLAALLANGLNLHDAIEQAQQRVHQMLSKAYTPGKHQAVPNRLCT